MSNNYNTTSLTPTIVLEWYKQADKILPLQFADGYLQSIDYEATKTQNKIIWKNVKQANSVNFLLAAGTVNTTDASSIYELA